MEYEYKIERWFDYNERSLNAMSEKGWQLVTVFTTLRRGLGTEYVCTFRRKCA